MAIAFLCPNGHKLNCREELAGKPGKCPKCGAPFTVPPSSTGQPDGEQPFDLGSVRANLARVETDGDGKTAAAQHTTAVQVDVEPVSLPGSAADAEPIVFLCPNGHRLHGSANLVGRAG